jgi:hypothetical protein
VKLRDQCDSAVDRGPASDRRACLADDRDMVAESQTASDNEAWRVFVLGGPLGGCNWPGQLAGFKRPVVETRLQVGERCDGDAAQGEPLCGRSCLH